MDEAELLDFVNRLAANLNQNGIGGGPFGALRKTAGTSCGGYSCDIVCAGEGGGQRQWDVLHDLELAGATAGSQTDLGPRRATMVERTSADRDRVPSHPVCADDQSPDETRRHRHRLKN